MYAIRTFLLIFMMFVGLAMLAWPGLYDTHKMSVAITHRHDYQNTEALQALSLAQTKNRREIAIWEASFGIIFLSSAVIFRHIGKRIHAHTSA